MNLKCDDCLCTVNRIKERKWLSNILFEDRCKRIRTKERERWLEGKTKKKRNPTEEYQQRNKRSESIVMDLLWRVMVYETGAAVVYLPWTVNSL